MHALRRAFGLPLAGLLLALVAFWLFGLILLPLTSMLQRAFEVVDRGGAAAQLSVEIDHAYLERHELERSRDALERAAASPAHSAPTPAAPGAVSPDDPFAGPASAPAAVSPDDPFGNAAGNAAGPAAGNAAVGGADGAGDDVATRRAALDTALADIDTRIAALETEEGATRGDGTRRSVGNFTSMSRVHLGIFVATLGYALSVAVLSFVVCYPVAYAVATAPTARRASLLLLCLVIPYAINELLRIFAWVMILEKRGLINEVLDALGLIDLARGGGTRFVASNAAVFAVMVYTYVLFMVFPIYNTLETLDRNQIDAARDLGASRWRIHARVVIPHARPGIAVGAIMTFMLSAGTIAVPEIVGRGMHPDWFSQVIYRRFFEANAWNQGAAYSVALMAACIVFVVAIMALFRVGIRDIAR